MAAAPRNVLPERLDELPPGDPLARRSRRDLHRVHRAMGSVSILRRMIGRLQLAAQPRRILELGAGDGTLLLRLAGALHPRWSGVRLTLLDRHELVTAETRAAYRRLDWHVDVVSAEALAWARSSTPTHYDLCVTTLFLHHFESADLALLLAAAAECTEAFIACEPRRDSIGRLGSSLVGLIGANEVTREDAVKSVAAGFRGRELTGLWNQAARDWCVDEWWAPPFTHCFTAVHRRAPPSGRG